MCDLTNPIFTDETKARQWLEAQRWPEGPFCPYCGQFDAVRQLGGKSMGAGWYHCKDCRRKFTVRVGTLLLEQNDEWAMQRARYMTLETIATLGDDDTVSLPPMAG